MKDFRNLEIGDYLRIFWRRKGYFLATAALVISGAVVYAWRMPLVYRSETRILVEPPAVPEDLVRSTVRATPQERINSIRAQVQSRSFIERVVEQYQLYGFGSPDFSMEDAVEAVRRNIQITVALENTFTLSFTATDPQAAHDTTQRLAESLVDESNREIRERATRTDGFIGDELRKSEQALAKSDDAIKRFKEQHLGSLPEQSASNTNALNALVSQLSAVDGALERAADRRKLLDFRLQEQRKLAVLSRSLMTAEATPPKPEVIQRPPSPEEAQLAAKRALLAELRAKYTDKHPDVVRLSQEVEELTQKVAAAKAAETKQADLTPLGAPEKPVATGASTPPAVGQFDSMLDLSEAEIRVEDEGIKNEIRKLERQKQDIQEQIRSIQARLNMAPALEQELLALSRDHDVQVKRYTDLQAKKFSTQVASTLDASRNTAFYRIIDMATVPERPAFPNRSQVILIGVGAGFLLGLGAAFGREYIDPTLESEGEASFVLRLPVLASVPEIPARRGKSGSVKRLKSGV